MEKSRELTKGELEVMQVIWANENSFLADIVGAMPEPKPAYTTVSTIIRILVKKGFVSYKSYSKVHCYYSVVTKEEYTEDVIYRVKKNFFGGSISNMLSFFAKKESLTNEERAELMELIESDK